MRSQAEVCRHTDPRGTTGLGDPFRQYSTCAMSDQREDAKKRCVSPVRGTTQYHQSREEAVLQFWRLSFSPTYDYDGIVKTIFEKTFPRFDITSYRVDETLGEFHLLLDRGSTKC